MGPNDLPHKGPGDQRVHASIRLARTSLCDACGRRQGSSQGRKVHSARSLPQRATTARETGTALAPHAGTCNSQEPGRQGGDRTHGTEPPTARHATRSARGMPRLRGRRAQRSAPRAGTCNSQEPGRVRVALFDAIAWCAHRRTRPKITTTDRFEVDVNLFFCRVKTHQLPQVAPLARGAMHAMHAIAG
jgi:hypothetical protein